MINTRMCFPAKRREGHKEVNFRIYHQCTIVFIYCWFFIFWHSSSCCCVDHRTTLALCSVWRYGWHNGEKRGRESSNKVSLSIHSDSRMKRNNIKWMSSGECVWYQENNNLKFLGHFFPVFFYFILQVSSGRADICDTPRLISFVSPDTMARRARTISGSKLTGSMIPYLDNT